LRSCAGGPISALTPGPGNDVEDHAIAETREIAGAVERAPRLVGSVVGDQDRLRHGPTLVPSEASRSARVALPANWCW
jgi:hypothetical protein